MAAGFQIDVERRPLGLSAGPLERDDLGVIASGEAMIARRDDSFPSHEHRADHRIGTGPARCFQSEAASHAQVTLVGISPGRVGQLLYSLLSRGAVARSSGSPLRSLMSSSNSTMNSLISLNER